jgi:hypothetical protein
VSVERIGMYHYVVDAPGGPYDVSAVKSDTDWWITPALNSAACRGANLRSRSEADEWSTKTTFGPYGSYEEALADVGRVAGIVIEMGAS